MPFAAQWWRPYLKICCQTQNIYDAPLRKKWERRESTLTVCFTALAAIALTALITLLTLALTGQPH